MKSPICTFFGAAFLLVSGVAVQAQGYPKVPPADQAAANARQAAADKRSDEIFARVKEALGF